MARSQSIEKELRVALLEKISPYNGIEGYLPSCNAYYTSTHDML